MGQGAFRQERPQSPAVHPDLGLSVEVTARLSLQLHHEHHRCAHVADTIHVRGYAACTLTILPAQPTSPVL